MMIKEEDLTWFSRLIYIMFSEWLLAITYYTGIHEGLECYEYDLVLSCTGKVFERSCLNTKPIQSIAALV